MRTALLAACALVVLAPGGASAQVAPQEIIRRAIQAHGGRDNLAKFCRYYIHARGIMCAGESQAPVEIEVWNDLPRRRKVVIRSDRGLLPPQVATVIDVEGGGWTHCAEQGTRDMTDKDKRTNHAARLAGLADRLFPLLEDNRFVLTMIGEVAVEGKPAIGVMVTAPGLEDYRLFFDKTTALLIKTERRGRDERTGQPELAEEYHDRYQDVAGARFATAGRKVAGECRMTVEYVEVRPLPALDENVFAKP
jgi:hypothetical protein